MRQTSHVVIFTKWKGNHNSESGGHLYIVFNSPTPSSHDWFIPSSSSLNAPCAMRHFDLRFCIIVLINMAKSQIGGISWDPITWTNLFCFLLILAAFSFVSNEVPPSPSSLVHSAHSTYDCDLETARSPPLFHSWLHSFSRSHSSGMFILFSYCYPSTPLLGL